MNRRVLLIDADTGFRDTLTGELARYKGVVVVAEPDPDRALALAAADPPSLIIIAVDEPDKTGYKVFQKCKKGALAKVPVLLVTSSLTPDSFAKHRGLKTHADEYIDKREMSLHELIGKVDNLIVLGEPSDDGISIPVEDDIPMEIGDGDVVLDETVAADDDHSAANEFVHEAATVGPGIGIKLESLVDAETDAAFASLLGNEPAESGPAADALAIPEPVPHVLDDEAPEPDPAAPKMQLADMESVPTPVHDDGHEPSDHFETVSRIADSHAPMVSEPAIVVDSPPPLDELPVEDAPLNLEEPMSDAEVQQEATRFAAPLTLESSPAIMLDEDELEPIDEDVPVELADDFPEPAEPEPVRLPRAHSEPVITSAPRPARETQGQRGGRDTQGPRLIETAAADVHEAATVMAPPITTDEAPRSRFIESSTNSGVRGPGSGSHPAVDLGLDAVAQDADREQSGVYDRKSLRKIGELERQIAQLKNELERARAQAESATKGGGREAQFLNLREANLAKEKEIKQLRTDLDAQSKQLGDVQSRLEQVTHAKTALETKNSQMEERLLEAGSLAKQLAAAEARASGHEAALDKTKAELTALRSELDARLADHATQVARFEQDSAAKLASLDAARAAAEQELVAERERRTASASVAEKTLRAEREQLVSRHQAELEQLRAEADAAVAAARSEADAAVAAARSEAGGAIAAAREDVEQKLAHAKADADARIAAAREEADQKAAVARGTAEQQVAAAMADAEEQVAAARVEAEAKVLAARNDADVALGKLRADADAALAKVRADADASMAKLRSNSEAALASLRAESEATQAKLRADAQAALAQQREELEAAHGAALDEAVEEVRRANASEHQSVVASMEKRHAGELVALKADLAEARTGGERALAEARATHAAELEQLAAKHASAVESIEEELQEQRERDAQSQAAALAQLKQELDRATAGHQVQLATAKRELDELLAQHEAHKGELHTQHQTQVSQLQAQHEAEQAKLHDEREQLAEGARRAAEAHKAAAAEAAAKHEAELSQVHEAAQREVGEAKAAMLALKRTADEAIGKLHAERAELEKAHAAALAEQKATHERALALANGDFLKQKGLADAEHGKAIAKLEEQHAAKLAELGSERDELRHGLSSARDTIKRSEGELASAVQTIADRNAELRAHAAAIAERDGRIAELRAEIQAIEVENTSYQEQVLRAYQKIKADEAMVARARKAMAIALTVLDDEGNPAKVEAPGFTPGPGANKPPTS